MQRPAATPKKEFAERAWLEQTTMDALSRMEC